MAEEIWRRKTDDEVAAAAQTIDEYTDEGRRVILAEVQRRGIPEPILAGRPDEHPRTSKEVATATKSRWNWLWPAVGTQESARSATRQAFWVAVYCASATSVFALLGAFGIQLFPQWKFDLAALADAGMFALIAWGLHKQSRFAAVSGLALYSFETIDRWIAVGPKNPVLAGIFILAFIAGVRGTFAQHAAAKAKPGERKNQNHPLEGGQ